VADALLVMGAIVCFVAVAYVFYMYAWTGQRHFIGTGGPYLYYGVPATLGVLLLASLWLRPAHRINIALCLCSISVCFYVLEFGTSVWSSLPSVQARRQIAALSRAASAAGIQDFDTRTKAEVMDDLREQGLDAVLAMDAKLLLEEQSDGGIKSALTSNRAELLPLSGIANRHTVVCNETGTYLTHTSDDHGFNNPRTVWDAGSIDVLAVGDSFTQGWCVAPDKSFVAQIRERFEATVNLGMQGNGPMMMLATLREYAHALRPNIVLWFYYEGNDLDDLAMETRSDLLTAYLSSGFSQRLLTRRAEIDRALTAYIAARRRSTISEALSVLLNPKQFPEGITDFLKLTSLRTTLGLVRSGPERPSSATVDASLIETFRQVVLEARRLASDMGAAFYFVYLPDVRYRNEPSRGPRMERARELVMQLLEDEGIPLIDIYPTFTAREDPLTLHPFRYYGHYTEEGHSIIAEEVIKVLSTGSEARGAPQ
jgi:lysophospholipase L1-like esterase